VFSIGERVWWDDPYGTHSSYYTIVALEHAGFYTLSGGHLAAEEELESEEEG
jgi:hypothetical protein